MAKTLPYFSGESAVSIRTVGALEIGWNAFYMEMPMSHVRVKSRIFDLNYFKYSSSFRKLQDL